MPPTAGPAAVRRIGFTLASPLENMRRFLICQWGDCHSRPSACKANLPAMAAAAAAALMG